MGRNRLSSNPSKKSPIPELEMYLVDSLPGFSCRKCARCCAGKLIPLYPDDMKRMKNRLRERFFEKTTRLERLITNAPYKMTMVEGRCILLDKDSCGNYDIRPNTCRRHPFLVSQEHILVSSTCRGVDWLSVQNSLEYKTLSKDISKGIDTFFRKRDSAEI
jgi:Fe-S-cluster containining protein